jgi:membrane-associated protein
MELFTVIFDFILNIEAHLGTIIAQYGALSYAVLFAIVFAETGLVFTPFLPGDSLLFAAGAFAAVGSFNIAGLLFLLFVAAFLGDTVNYWMGRYFGQKMVNNPRIPVNQEHLDKTSAFYEKHGRKAIILARFMPIVRTFAPFVAGMGGMDYRKFMYYNAVGGVLWVFGFTLLGYLFGNIPSIKDNFSVVIIVIIALSVVPMAIGFVRARLSRE